MTMHINISTACFDDWRVSLTRNGYGHLIDLVNALTRAQRAKASGANRNKFLLFAGTAEGRPCVHEGITFPILAGCRLREGMTLCSMALGKDGEVWPAKRNQDAQLAGRRL